MLIINKTFQFFSEVSDKSPYLESLLELCDNVLECQCQVLLSIGTGYGNLKLWGQMMLDDHVETERRSQLELEQVAINLRER